MSLFISIYNDDLSKTRAVLSVPECASMWRQTRTLQNMLLVSECASISGEGEKKESDPAGLHTKMVFNGAIYVGIVFLSLHLKG